MRMRTLAAFIVLSVFIAVTGSAAQDPKALAPKADAVLAAVVPAPELARIKWENHRLRSANLALQAENLKLQQAAEDKAADVELAAMQQAVGDKYAPRINEQTGLLEFRLLTVPHVDTAGTTAPADKKGKP